MFKSSFKWKAHTLYEMIKYRKTCNLDISCIKYIVKIRHVPD